MTGSAAPPLLTIITVTENPNSPAFLDTARSIGDALTTDMPVEWLIVPGKAGANSPAGADILPTNNQGIYPAMNDGLTAAKGTYVWFLNGGDRLASPAALEAVLECPSSEQPDFLYADSHEFGGTVPADVRLKPARPALAWPLGMFTHHQAMIYRRMLVPDAHYPTHHDVAADYAFTIQHLQSAARTVRLPMAIADISVGGFSSQNSARGREQQHQIRCQLGGVPRFLSLTIRGMQWCSQGVRARLPWVWHRLRMERPTRSATTSY
ncbi:MAG: hypothetical protein KI792_02610 [Alphaproteobacteria bacterium]|nr:hypothetical protein [Alphaproteobacteria bacterium SS10]